MKFRGRAVKAVFFLLFTLHSSLFTLSPKVKAVFFLLFTLYSSLFTLSPKAKAAETSVDSKNNAMFHYLLYERYSNEGKYLDGLNELEKAVKLDSSSTFLLKEIIPVYFDMGNYDEVLNTSEKLLKKKAGAYTAYYYMAGVYEIRDELDNAVKYYEKALAIKPDSADVAFSLGRVYMKEKKYLRAEELFKKAVAASPDDPVMRLTLAVFYEAEKKWDDAVAQYREIYRINPDSPNPLIKAGAIYAKLGRNEEAMSVFNEVLEKDPENFNALIAMAGIYEKEQKWDKVIESLMKVHKANDGYAEVEMYLGLAYLNEGKNDKAQKFFSRAVSLAPENSALYYSLALIYMDAKNYTEALDEIDKCEKYGGANSDTVFMKGVCLDSLGRKDEAAASFKKAIKLDPENHRALNYLSYSWAEAGENLKLAGEYVGRALKLDPDNPAYLDTAGWVMYKKGNYKYALKYLKKASSLLSDPEIWEHLGDTYLKAGYGRKAKNAYGKAVSSGAAAAVIKKKIEKIK